ncbi:MAG: hypothetical protein AAB483_01705 [Patescibacteria group bacterium]
MNNCKCFHHGFAKVMSVLAGLAAIAFLYTAWSGNLLFDMPGDGYFAHVVVFSLVMFGTKMCKCCCDAGCGKGCGSGICMPGNNDHKTM